MKQPIISSSSGSIRAGSRDYGSWCQPLVRTSVVVVALVLLFGHLRSESAPAPRKPVRIGALTDSWGPTPQVAGLRDGLATLGYRENDDFVIGVRFTEGDSSALPAAASELVQRGADIIFASDAPAAKAAHSATAGIPIVFAGGGDPVKLGLIQSFARPGGRITGVTDLDLELAAKRLELFHRLIPTLKRVLFVHRRGDDYAAAEAQAYRDTARQFGLVVVEKSVATEAEAQGALSQAKRGTVDGLLQPRFLSLNIPGLILEAAVKQRIPAMFSAIYWVERGGLVSYGPNYYESGRQAARLVDKILKGESPSLIPVEANPKIEMALNRTAIRHLNLTIAPDQFLRADRIIE